MKLADLMGKKIAILGAGREALAIRGVLLKELPQLAVDVVCEHPPKDTSWMNFNLGDCLRVLVFADAGLADYDVLIKSPGISPYRQSISQALLGETILTSGTNLWFSGHPAAKTICITGTKGKSTSSALLSHLLRSLGQKTELAGNIGIPLMERWGRSVDQWVIEISSFQAADFAATTDIAVMVSLFAEHLDWHGNEECYIRDKLNLLKHSRISIVNAADPHVLKITSSLDNRAFFNHSDGWRESDGDIYFADQRICESRSLPLRGQHNASNICAVLTVIDWLGLDARASLPALVGFEPLPHRLQSLGVRDGIEWINDSIATSPAAVVAGVKAMPVARSLVLLLGGYERGVDWQLFKDFLQNHIKKNKRLPLFAIIGLPDNGARVIKALQIAGIELEGGYHLVESLKAAVERAREITPAAGIVLLSPGAPSFSEFENFEQRGEMFQYFAGF